MSESRENSEFKKYFPQMKDDRYDYQGHLGKGRAGQVFKARDKLLKKDIVIKVMCSEVPRKEDFQRFQREARAFSSLQHPNILRVLDFGLAEDQTPYLVTDFIDGVTLNDYQKKHKHFSLDDTIHIGIQLSHAMAHSHNRGVLHRDLKPSNILLTNPNSKKKHVYILDFGLAKFTDNHPARDNTLTRPGQILGTAEYMSPEQARGISCDERSDIYSLGCILFEMVSGKPPFEAPALLEVIRMQCEETPPMEKIEQVDGGAKLVGILEKCLEKAPEDRFESMSQLEAALKELVDPGSSSKEEKESKPTYVETAEENALDNSADYLANASEDFNSETMTAPPSSPGDKQKDTGTQAGRKLKAGPIILVCFLLISSTTLIIFAITGRDNSIPMGGDIIEKKPVIPKNEKSEDLVKDAMILSGRMDGTHLTLAGTIGTDALLLDAARSGKAITVVDASRAHVTDEGIEAILRINPGTIILSGTGITDNAIFKMRGNHRIRHLIIDDTEKVDGSSFKILPTIANLEILSIGGPGLKNEDLSSLSNCAKLKALCINSSPNLSDEVFTHLSKIPHLSTIYIGDCPGISPESIASLKKTNRYARTVVSKRSIPVEKIDEMQVVLGKGDDYGFLD